ncbi:MAG: hypothetical protein LBE06_11695 [Azoarcus sp.]|jgi:hypothetical protein|nr:hypothetical protein [Azoarcus sp.]
MPDIGKTIIALCMFGTFTFGVFAGVQWGRAGIARIEADWAAERARLAGETNAALERVREFERAGEALAARLFETERAREALGEEKDREISRLSTGRPCLSVPVTRLLNDRAAAGAVPAPAQRTARAAAGAAADPDVRWATDADVALWARHAQEQYDTCRARIAALNSFFSTAARVME